MCVQRPTGASGPRGANASVTRRRLDLVCARHCLAVDQKWKVAPAHPHQSTYKVGVAIEDVACHRYNARPSRHMRVRACITTCVAAEYLT